MNNKEQYITTDRLTVFTNFRCRLVATVDLTLMLYAHYDILIAEMQKKTAVKSSGIKTNH